MSLCLAMNVSLIFCMAGKTVVEPLTTTVPAAAAKEAKPTQPATKAEIKVRFIIKFLIKRIFDHLSFQLVRYCETRI